MVVNEGISVHCERDNPWDNLWDNLPKWDNLKNFEAGQQKSCPIGCPGGCPMKKSMNKRKISNIGTTGHPLSIEL